MTKLENRKLTHQAFKKIGDFLREEEASVTRSNVIKIGILFSLLSIAAKPIKVKADCGADPCACSDCNCSNCNCHSDSGSDCHTSSNCHSNSGSDCHSDAGSDCHSDAGVVDTVNEIGNNLSTNTGYHNSGVTDCHSDAGSDCHSDAGSDCHTSSNCHSNSGSDCHSNSNCDCLGPCDNDSTIEDLVFLKNEVIKNKKLIKEGKIKKALY